MVVFSRPLDHKSIYFDFVLRALFENADLLSDILDFDETDNETNTPRLSNRNRSYALNKMNSLSNAEFTRCILLVAR